MAADEGGDSWHLTDREEAFEDATDVIDSHSDHGSDHQGDQSSEVENLRQLLDEKSLANREIKEERENFLKEAALIRKQLKALVSGEAEEDVASDNESPREILAQCLHLVENASKDRSEKEDSIRDLRSQIAEDSSIHQMQQNVEIVSDRIINSLAMVAHQEEPLSDFSLSGRMDYLEKGVSLVLDHYNWYTYETNQLWQCLLENGATIDPQEGVGAVFGTARAELIALKTKEMEATERMNLLQIENQRLAEENEKGKSMMESLKKEIETVKEEVEQEKNRYAMTKEKLSMAVTKGKALVQQRDSLKQSLAEKSNELEKCVAKLLEKVEADETMTMELERYEIQVKALQSTLTQNETTLNNLSEMLQHLNVSQESKSTVVDWMLIAVAMLNNVYQEWNQMREKLDQDFPSIVLPPEHRPNDNLGRLTWLLDERNRLQEINSRLNDALSVFDFPEDISPLDVESRVNWLKSSFADVKVENEMLRNEMIAIKKAAQDGVGFLTVSFISELQENEYRKDEMIEFNQTAQHVVIEKDAPALVDSSAHKFDDMRHLFVLQCVDFAVFCELLEEDMTIRSEMSLVSEKLASASQELGFLREERAALERDLIKSEEKSGALKEKLSLAVKKGKGLLQDRENMRTLIDDKNSEIENLKRELKELESSLTESLSRIGLLSADSEKLTKMEADHDALKDEKGQLDMKLRKLIESVDSVSVASDVVFDDPVDKTIWLAGFVRQSEEAKNALDRDLSMSKQEIATIRAESEEKVRLMEQNMLILEQRVAELENEKEKIQEKCREAEQRVEKMVEEARDYADELGKCWEARKGLEKDLKNAELELSVLRKEREDIHSLHTNVSSELLRVKDEHDFNTTSLVEAQDTIKSLQESLEKAEASIALLTRENDDFVKGKASLEDTITSLQKECSEAEQNMEKLREESGKFAEELANSSKSRNALDSALKNAEIELSMLKKEREDFHTKHSDVFAEMEKVKVEHDAKNTSLVDALDTVKNLQESLEKAEASISALTLENNDHVKEKASLEETISSLQEKCKEAEYSIEKHEEEARKYSEELAECSEAKKTAEFELSELKKEREQFRAMHMSVSSEMEKIKGENDFSATSLAEAKNAVKSLQESLETAEARVSLLRLEIIKFEKEKLSLDETISSLREEIEKSLSNIASLENEKIAAEKEIVSLKSKLETCMDELTLAKNKLEETSSQHAREISELEFQSRNDNLVSVINSCHEKESESLKHIDDILGNFTNYMLEKVPNLFEDHSLIGKGFDAVQCPPLVCDNSAVGEVAESLKRSHSLKIEIIDNFSKRLTSARDASISLIQQMELLEEKAANIHETEKAVTLLENHITTTIKELQSEVENNKLAQQWSPAERNATVESNNDAHLKLAETLSLSTKNIRRLLMAFEQMHDKAAEERVIMKTKVEESEKALERTTEERNALLSKLHETEASLQDLQDRYEEQEIKSSDHLANSEALKQKELELVTARELLKKYTEEERKDLKFKSPFITGLEDSCSFSNDDDNSYADSVPQLQNNMNASSSNETNAISVIKEKESEFEKMKRTICETMVALRRISSMFGSKTNLHDDSLRKLISYIEKQILMLRSEDEHSSSQIRSLKSELQICEKRITELSSKVKYYEDQNPMKDPQPLSSHERNVKAESSASEISEIDNLGLVSKSLITPIPAAHVRTMRKGSGSADHLAINIDSESSSLMSNDDKDYLFKSLNTSGIIPKQGKSLADKVDGLWVNGGRMLMNRPKARLSLIAYTLFVHLWLLVLII